MKAYIYTDKKNKQNERRLQVREKIKNHKLRESEIEKKY